VKQAGLLVAAVRAFTKDANASPDGMIEALLAAIAGGGTAVEPEPHNDAGKGEEWSCFLTRTFLRASGVTV
jgi:hypothetical protein